MLNPDEIRPGEKVVVLNPLNLAKAMGKATVISVGETHIMLAKSGETASFPLSQVAAA